MKLSECLTSRHQAQVMKLVRELVDSVVVYKRKDDELVRFDVRGRLSALLSMADGAAPGHGQNMSADLVVPRDRIELRHADFQSATCHPGCGSGKAARACLSRPR